MDLEHDGDSDNPINGGIKKSESRRKLEEPKATELFTSLLARDSVPNISDR